MTPPSSESTKWLSWSKLAVIVIGVEITGLLLGSVIMNQLGYFAPPLFPYTPFIFLLFWIPVLVIGILLRPRGGFRVFVLAIVVAGVIGIVGLALIGPDLNYTTGVCTSAPLPDQSVHYDCFSAPNYQGAKEHFALEGREGWPFVRVVHIGWES